MISAKEKLQIETASVETVVTGGAICSPDLFKKMHKTFGPQRVVVSSILKKLYIYNTFPA